MPAKIEVVTRAIQLLQTPESLCTVLEAQEKALADAHLRKKPCPACQRLINCFEAADERYTIGDLYPDDGYRCTSCNAQLVYTVPVFNPHGWQWALKSGLYEER